MTFAIKKIMKFECTNCGQHLEADESQQGLQFECPSCSTTVEVPTTEPIESQSAPPPLPQPAVTNEEPPERTPNVEPDKEDKEKMAGLRGALLVMPLYMLSLLFLLFTLWQSTGFKANPAVAKLGWFALIILIGVSARSWQCLRWIHTDPYKAVAFGKKLFLIFIVLSCLDTLISEWPSDKFEGPLSALSTERVSYGYYDQRQLYVVDPNETMLIEAGFWAWLSFLFTFASQLVEELAIFAFISVLYTRLRGSRPDFSWDHFLNEISFGKWGTKYNWRESGPGE
jgi:DNA-directed RNA polymerase subunit RPC12/RpoP